MPFVELMLLALLIEIAVGWPDRLFATIKHPVVWIGCLITYLEKRFNTASDSASRRYVYGVATSFVVISSSVIAAIVISLLLPNNLLGWGLEALIASSLLASRSLYVHVNAVAKPLQEQNLPAARESLSHIVGRDTEALDQSMIAGAAIESLAENASDGVYAPLFWGVLLGLPGIAAYKAINTLDSMIGHRSTRYIDYGRFAAKLDDAVNLLPARITALLIAIVGGSLSAFGAIASDARNHRSPNAGWPEGAMANALNIRLSGPRLYNNEMSDEPWLNSGGNEPQPSDVRKALRIFANSVGLTILILALGAFFA